MASIPELKSCLLQLACNDGHRGLFQELVGAHDYTGLGQFLETAYPQLDARQIEEMSRPARSVALADSLLQIHRWAKRAAVSLYAALPEHGAVWPDQALPALATSWSANGRNPAIELLVEAVDGLRPIADIRADLLALDGRIDHDELLRLADGLD